MSTVTQRCPWCTDRFFRTSEQKFQHLKNEHYNCNACGLAFDSHPSLLNHYRTSNRHLYCELCDEHFENGYDLQEHERWYHPAYLCEICNDGFDEVMDYEDHRESYHFCSWCGDYFDLEEHDDQVHVKCNFTACAAQVFDDTDALLEHWKTSAEHNWCDRCSLHLLSSEALRLHMEQTHGIGYCEDCKQEFKGLVGLKEHYVQSPKHAYCLYCLIHFPTQHDLLQHFANKHFSCHSCRKVFKNDYGLQEHYRQSEAHHYCADCDQHFQSVNNLHNHLRSSRHSSKIYACPFAGCTKTFVNQSAVVLHLDSGACSSGIDRAIINHEVRKMDKNNIITDPTRLLTGPEDAIVTLKANEYSWNGYAYECYLCHNQYRHLNALNQHLASPRHQEKVYICPLSTCRIRFSTLSGLWQHVESERCGVARFENVKRVMDGIVGRMASLQC